MQLLGKALNRVPALGVHLALDGDQPIDGGGNLKAVGLSVLRHAHAAAAARILMPEDFLRAGVARQRVAALRAQHGRRGLDAWRGGA